MNPAKGKITSSNPDGTAESGAAPSGLSFFRAPQEAAMKRKELIAVVVIRGGVAEVAHQPIGVRVTVIDMDNLAADGWKEPMREEHLARVIARAAAGGGETTPKAIQ